MSQHYTDASRESETYSLPDVEVWEDDTKGWFWWICFPGCLPESEPHGPYASEQDAIEAMQDECSE